MSRPCSAFRIGSLLLLFTQALPAQDRVTFSPAENGGTVTAIGEVTEYTGRELVLKTINGTQHLSPESIIRIETNSVPAYQKALIVFQSGETETAQTLFRNALNEEHRPWVQREIRSWLVKCSLRREDIPGALQEFHTILLSDPQTRFWGIAPLAWAPSAVSEDLRIELQPALKSPRETSRLLAASWLLLDPVQGEAAERVLLDLSRDINPILSAYSRIQLWRLSIGSRQVTEIMLADWRKEIDRLSPKLRSGPQYLLARGYEVRGDFRMAAAEAMWLPTVYADHEPLAARALFDAADGMTRSGLVDEALVLKQELMMRYAWSREASLTRSQLRSSPQPNGLP